MSAIEQLSCRELVELVTDYLEGTLPEDERLRFEEHVAVCSGCRRYLDQIRTTIRLAGAVTPDAVPEDAERALLAAFRGWKSRA